MSHFDPRDLRAFSVEPLLLYPTHYTGEPGYFSDTETSTIWDDEAVSTDWDRQYAQKTAQQAQIHSVAQNSVTGDTPPPASRASRDELWVLYLFLNYTTEWQNTLTHRRLTPQCPAVPSSLATHQPIALQLAGMLEHHWLAGWFCTKTHKLFLFPLYLFHQAFQRHRGTKRSPMDTSKCLKKDEDIAEGLDRETDIWELDLVLLVNEQDRWIFILKLYCNIKTDTVLNKINLQPVYISTVYHREGNDILIASQNHF